MLYAGRFDQPDCTDCDRLKDYIKDEGADTSVCVAFTLGCFVYSLG